MSRIAGRPSPGIAPRIAFHIEERLLGGGDGEQSIVLIGLSGELDFASGPRLVGLHRTTEEALASLADLRRGADVEPVVSPGVPQQAGAPAGEAALATPDDMAACVLRAQATGSAPAVHVEELEVDLASLARELQQGASTVRPLSIA